MNTIGDGAFSPEIDEASGFGQQQFSYHLHAPLYDPPLADRIQTNAFQWSIQCWKDLALPCFFLLLFPHFPFHSAQLYRRSSSLTLQRDRVPPATGPSHILFIYLKSSFHKVYPYSPLVFSTQKLLLQLGRISPLLFLYIVSLKRVPQLLMICSSYDLTEVSLIYWNTIFRRAGTMHNLL